MRSDKKIMSSEQLDAFVEAGCIPTCHVCKKAITVVDPEYVMLEPFRTLRGHWTTTVEVMACWDCRNATLHDKELERAMSFMTNHHTPPPKPIERESRAGLGCMVVNGRIIPGMAE